MTISVPALVATIASQLAGAAWLTHRTRGRGLLTWQAEMLAVLAAFMGVSGALRYGVPPELVDTLEMLYALLGSALSLIFAVTITAWASPQQGVVRLKSGLPYPLLAVGLLVGTRLLDPTFQQWLPGLRWYVVWISVTTLPAVGVLVAKSGSRLRNMDPNAVYREGPWLTLSGLILVKGVVWIVAESSPLSSYILYFDGPLMLLWAWSAERAARFELTVDAVGTDSVRALRESLFLLSPEGRIDYANPAAIALLGIDPRTVTFRALCPEWPCSGATQLRGSGGERIPVVLSAAPLVISGVKVGHAVSATDVTELQRAIDDANASEEKARKAARARQDFVAVMSHEIRTPMNAIVGLAHLLEETKLNEVQAGWAGTMRQSADALLTVVTDILDFSRIESGRVDVEMLPIDVMEVLEGAAAVVQNLAVQRGLRFTVDVDGLPPRVESDPTRLRQIVLNLLSNAMKFTEAGDVSLVASYDDGILTVRVEDTGIGIETGRLYSLFDAFTQADVSTTRRFGGTGLGLAISAQLAEVMGGMLFVTSAVGEGSVFALSLPAPLVEMETVELIQTETLDLSALRVLVVEDNPINRTVLRAVLSRVGICPDEACDGAEGVARVMEHAYDVVFMDLQMPVMDGWQALARISEALGSERPYLVSHSANVGRVDADRAKECGAHMHLPKPASPAAVEAVLRAVVASRPLVGSAHPTG